MIFLTVGLHEQPFDRIVKLVDEINNYETFIQYGYSNYIPKNPEANQFLKFEEIKRLMLKADVVITHGGTGSLMLALSLGKKPIVAPRYKKFNEHVDDHQHEIVNKIAEKKLIIPFYENMNLYDLIKNYDSTNRTNLKKNIRSIDRTILKCLQ